MMPELRKGRTSAAVMMTEQLRWAAVTRMTVLVLLVATHSGGQVVRGDDASTCPPSGDRGPSMDEILYYSDVVVQGMVLRQFPSGGDPAVYTAEMEVYCVYKGHRVPTLINITDAGEFTFCVVEPPGARESLRRVGVVGG